MTDFHAMFNDASEFNQNISSWNTSAVTDMSFMFAQAFRFNADIGNWNMAEVTSMEGCSTGIGTWGLVTC